MSYEFNLNNNKESVTLDISDYIKIKKLAKEIHKTEDKHEKNNFIKIYQDYIKNVDNLGFTWTNHLAAFQSINIKENILFLPNNSFCLNLHFHLIKPFISKDDDSFYIHQNPIRKEWVTKQPMISPTNWKGAFRAVLRDTQDEKKIIHLLGNDRLEENLFERGRLIFSPTFFNKIGIETINPQDRKTSAGSGVITIECVPIPTKGVFSLLYMPLFVENPTISPPSWKEVLEDLCIVCETANSMLCEKGFGAKTSSGYGRAKIEKWEIAINHRDKVSREPYICKPFDLYNNLLEWIDKLKELEEAHG